MAEPDYHPNLEVLKEYFDLDADYLNFKFLLPQYLKGEGIPDEVLLSNIRQFCDQWTIDKLHSSNFYYLAKRTLSSKTLDAFKDIGQSPRIAGHNFRSDAYYGLAAGYEGYFKAHRIEQQKQMLRHEIIGRLMMLSGLAFRRNQEKRNKYDDASRKDIDASDPDLTGKEIAELVRNWIKRRQLKD